MSEPTRYDFDEYGGCYELSHGDYVLYKDYARLKTEVERLTKVECQFAVSSEGEKSDQSDKIGKITFGFNTLAEFERDVESARQMIPLILAAAKEGKPSV